MKKFMKILTVLMIVMMIVSTATMVFAAPNPSNYQGEEGFETDKIDKIGNQVITILSTGGSIISVIILIVLGIKYMMGSAEEKADYKKTLMPYVIGAAFVFAASALAGIIYGFTKGLGG